VTLQHGGDGVDRGGTKVRVRAALGVSIGLKFPV
jgi:hypothetical protein